MSRGYSGRSDRNAASPAQPRSYIEDLSEYTSASGPYSCPSNTDRSDPNASGKGRNYNIYPNVMMPMMLPIDKPVYAYNGDPPITNTGDILARIIARGMFSARYVPHLIYSSPALRCLQTANAIRSILKCEAKIRVEPALFENMWLYPNGLPDLPSPGQRAQFHVDEGYRPYMQISDLLKGQETPADYNQRIRNILMHIARIHEVSPVKKDQIVLIVAHASTVDLAAGHLARHRKSSAEEIEQSRERIPCGSLLILERVQGRRGWTPNLYAIPKMSYADQSTEFDSTFVLREPVKVQK
ncbi:unnamed protein product [Cylicocyclus nassatus]|uniref:Phosphoglycerate mutase family protein n=1 Tax=Cylicocyclus nassatus TaxID=53992 RepID=A0AA36DP34_CYLNA|nr:unnamed protein product [Cylicocyclus nassatus]